MPTTRKRVSRRGAAIPPKARARLHEMFEADRTAPDWDNRFPAYSYVHSEIGGKPWWPPLEEVWRMQGEPAPYDDPEHAREAWALLSDLFEDYMQSRKN